MTLIHKTDIKLEVLFFMIFLRHFRSNSYTKESMRYAFEKYCLDYEFPEPVDLGTGNKAIVITIEQAIKLMEHMLGKFKTTRGSNSYATYSFPYADIRAAIEARIKDKSATGMELVVYLDYFHELKQKLIGMKMYKDSLEEMHEQEGIVPMETAAKILSKECNIVLGRSQLFEYLRDNNIMLQTSNTPYQRFINSGYFRVETNSRSNKLYGVTRVTAKGLQWLKDKINEEVNNGSTREETSQSSGKLPTLLG